MNVDTIHSLNDIVYFMQDNKIKKGKIEEVVVIRGRRNIRIRYCVKGIHLSFEESRLFKTKEDLVGSIILD